jgi:hypothetical protein
MCRTMTTGTGKLAGRRGINCLSACGPPVDTPITRMSVRRGLVGAVSSAGAVGADGAVGGGDAGALVALATPRSLAPAAALTFAMRSSATSSTRSDASAVGFCTTSTAPASSARMTCSPVSLAALSRTTGTGRRAIWRRRKSSPSSCGMLRSSVTTSGRSCSTSSSASAPSRAAPTTSRNGLRESICRTTLRTNAESSTISTRTTPLIKLSLRCEMRNPKASLARGLLRYVNFDIRICFGFWGKAPG